MYIIIIKMKQHFFHCQFIVSLVFDLNLVLARINDVLMRQFYVEIGPRQTDTVGSPSTFLCGS